MLEKRVRFNKSPVARAVITRVVSSKQRSVRDDQNAHATEGLDRFAAGHETAARAQSGVSDLW